MWYPARAGSVVRGSGGQVLESGDPALEVMDVSVTGVYQGRRRMTLTYRLLERAPRVMWLITGEDKIDALRRLQAGDRSIQADRISSANALVIADEAAVGTMVP